MKLPNKPSRLIRLALDDLKKVERSKKYKIDMVKWHEPNSKCSVCLAGAVMAKTLKCSSKSRQWPARFSEDTKYKLQALDDLRAGNVYSAFCELNKDNFGNRHVKGFDRCIVEYHLNKKKFYNQMRQLARDLEKGGY